jgi:hypothetical protein
MKTASLVLLFFSGLGVTIGLIPCLGWLNWTAVPLSASTALVGLVGLATDRDEHGRHRGVPFHLAALVGGMVLVAVGALRCFLGCGVV